MIKDKKTNNLATTYREKQHLSPMYAMYANASNNTPSYTHVKSCMVWWIHPPMLSDNECMIPNYPKNLETPKYQL